MSNNILKVNNRSEFRKWLAEHSGTEKSCYVALKRGRPKDDGQFYYLDAVEEALCFGWIDSTLSIIDGTRLQKFTPRTEKSNWTELNKERVRRLEKLGLMTDAGRRVLPDMGFAMDENIRKDIEQAGVYDDFMAFPELYQRVRAYNLSFTKKYHPGDYKTALNNFIEATEKGKMYGQWDDYGRLTSY